MRIFFSKPTLRQCQGSFIGCWAPAFIEPVRSHKGSLLERPLTSSDRGFGQDIIFNPGHTLLLHGPFLWYALGYEGR